MKIIYIAHPIGGNVEKNLAAIRRIVREINLEEFDTVPFVPYYADCVSMLDSIAWERNRGIMNDIEIFNRKFIDEVRLYGDKISDGMKKEIILAVELGIPVIAMTPETKEALIILEKELPV